MEDNPYRSPQAPPTPPRRRAADLWRRLAFGPIFHPLEFLVLFLLIGAVAAAVFVWRLAAG
jgi:hypothetical protein